jgi:uncharacterized protein YaaR (DUF327 family)
MNLGQQIEVKGTGLLTLPILTDLPVFPYALSEIRPFSRYICTESYMCSKILSLRIPFPCQYIYVYVYVVDSLLKDLIQRFRSPYWCPSRRT